MIQTIHSGRLELQLISVINNDNSVCGCCGHSCVQYLFKRQLVNGLLTFC